MLGLSTKINKTSVVKRLVWYRLHTQWIWQRFSTFMSSVCVCVCVCVCMCMCVCVCCLSLCLYVYMSVCVSNYFSKEYPMLLPIIHRWCFRFWTQINHLIKFIFRVHIIPLLKKLIIITIFINKLMYIVLNIITLFLKALFLIACIAELWYLYAITL